MAIINFLDRLSFIPRAARQIRLLEIVMDTMENCAEIKRELGGCLVKCVIRTEIRMDLRPVFVGFRCTFISCVV